MSTQITLDGETPLAGAMAMAGPHVGPHTAKVVQKKEFVDRVLAVTGARKADARPIIEATLLQLGEVLSAGQTLVVPPFGRARISLEKDLRGGDVITLRLRRKPMGLE